MKKIYLFILFQLALTIHVALAQKPMEKAKETTNKLAQQTEQTKQNTEEISKNVQLTTEQIRAAIENVKETTKLFEPILVFRNKNRQQATSSSMENVGTMPMENTSDNQENATTQMPYIPESNAYNADATANLGSQNHNSFGCYVDVMRGRIMDDLDAAIDPQSVDVIFTATDYFNSQVPTYALLTPAYVKYDNFSSYHFRGTKFKDNNIPIKNWEEVNESEIALTTLTGEQFERIQTNKQLLGIIKQIPNFSSKVESRTKLDGKVFAVRTVMGDRTAYGLIYIMNHYGTTGPNGYLKIKLKVTGFDADGDNLPDGQVYEQQQY